MFDFRLILSLPKPTGSFMFCLPVFLCLAYPYLQYVEPTTQDLSGALHGFLQREQGDQPKHPQILIAGSSASGMAYHIETLEERTGMPAAKISMDGGHIGDVLDILECFPNECQYAKILLLELLPARIGGGDSGVSEDFASRMDQIRGSFYGKLRGETNFDIVRLFKRSSLWRFLWLANLRTKTRDNYFEDNWDNPDYAAAQKANIAPLQKQEAMIRKLREGNKEEDLPIQKSDPQKIEKFYQVLDLCRNRNVFVVICVPPEWYGYHSITQRMLEQPTEEPYISLLREADKRPDCAVTIARDFEEITSEGTDADYLFDRVHMTRKGAVLYTNWLLDRLLENSKTAAIISP